MKAILFDKKFETKSNLNIKLELNYQILKINIKKKEIFYTF